MSYRPYSEEFKARVVAAVRDVGFVQPIARAYGVHDTTVRNWCQAAGVKLRPGIERMQIGGLLGTSRQWPNAATRRARARRMRVAGATLEEIREKLGYGSISSVHYALRQPARKSQSDT